MKKILLNLLALFICTSPILKAQSSLGIDTTQGHSVPSPTSFNNVDTYVVHIKNYGPQAYNGFVQLDVAVDSGGIFSPVDTASVLATLAVGASFTDSIHVPINNSFRSGINTVVIWPRTTNTAFITHDSLKVSVFVTGTWVGIENYTESKPIVFPNPMQGKVFIANKGANFVIEQVRIFDISGQLLWSEKFTGSLDVSKLAAGVYTLEFTDKSGKLCRYKVVKE